MRAVYEKGKHDGMRATRTKQMISRDNYLGANQSESQAAGNRMADSRPSSLALQRLQALANQSPAVQRLAEIGERIGRNSTKAGWLGTIARTPIVQPKFGDPLETAATHGVNARAIRGADQVMHDMREAAYRERHEQAVAVRERDRRDATANAANAGTRGNATGTAAQQPQLLPLALNTVITPGVAGRIRCVPGTYDGKTIGQWIDACISTSTPLQRFSEAIPLLEIHSDPRARSLKP